MTPIFSGASGWCCVRKLPILFCTFYIILKNGLAFSRGHRNEQRGQADGDPTGQLVAFQSDGLSFRAW